MVSVRLEVLSGLSYVFAGKDSEPFTFDEEAEEGSTVGVEGDARAEIALRNSWAHVADILEERVAKSLGQFQQGTHQKEKFKIYARSARASPITPLRFNP